MSLHSMLLIFSLCAFFFVVLFVLEGYSDDGLDGILVRKKSISGATMICIITLALFLMSDIF